MRAAVDPLLAQIAELAPEETEEAAPGHTRPRAAADAATTETGIAAPEKRRAAPEALPQAKSVRISLERLDRMMNAVGELVINRTRMVGRLAELAKLVEVLNFSKSRLSGKVSEFQEKHEFSKVQPLLVPGSRAPQMDTFRREFPGACLRSPATTCSSSANWKWIATTTSTFFPARSPKFPRTSTSSSPSSKVSWAAWTPISTNSPSSRTTFRTKSPPRAWCPSAISTRASPAPCAMPPTPPASSSSFPSKARTPNSTTISFSTFPIR